MNTNIRLLLILISLLANFNILNGQSKQLREKLYGIHEYIAFHYSPDDSLIAELCLQTVVFLKFEIDENGLLSGVDFNRGTPGVIKDGFLKAIEEYNKNPTYRFSRREWKIMRGKSIIYPTEFTYKTGCPGHDSWGLKPPLARDTVIKNLLTEIQAQHTNEALHNMFNFENSMVDEFNCIVLVPNSVSVSY